MYSPNKYVSQEFVDAARRFHLGRASDGDRALLEEIHWRRCAGGFNNGVYAAETPIGPCCFKNACVRSHRCYKRLFHL